MASADTFTAVAVCGCGHDGRLGLGPGEANVSTPTLLPAFLPAEEGLPQVVYAVASGGYHTLAVTSRGLYGWGVNEDGQLGLGKQQPRVHTPTRLTFFDKMKIQGADFTTEMHLSHTGGNGPDEREEEERVLAVACGGRHSFVLTTEALYACGANDSGQLGLGTPLPSDPVFDWHMVYGYGPRWRRSHPSAPCLVLPSSGTSSGMCIMNGRVVRVSCGTSHTLVGLEEVYTRAASGGEGACYTPVMVLAAGMGDFGELGYDGTPEETEKARHRTKQAAALLAATVVDRQGGPGPAGPSDVSRPTGHACGGGGAGGASNDPLYAFKMRHQKVVRRAAFGSSLLRPVHLPEVLSHGVARGALATIALGDMTEEEMCKVESCRRALKDACRRAGLEEILRAHITYLEASHLHSAVAISHEAPAPGRTDASPTTALHWGCYYCDKVETLASSVPRAVSEEWPTDDQDASCARVHGGNEVCFVYHRDPSAQPCVGVLGKGNLGLDEPDDFSDSLRGLPGTDGAVKVTGKDHFLLLLQRSSERANQSDGEAGEVDADQGTGPQETETLVVGFGDNLHGQLGTVRPVKDANMNCDEDAVLTPRVILQRGDVLAGSWVVERVRDAEAGARHSVFLLDVRRAPSAERVACE